MSKIEWTDVSWNPVRGCSRVSEGCRHCYAERQAMRFRGSGKPFENVVDEYGWTGKVELIEHKLEEPLHWRKPRRIFVNSMSDLFHEALSFDDISRVYGVMQQANWHTYQILTKRERRLYEFTAWLRWQPWALRWPRYVHLGVSVENRATLDRIDWLRKTPAAVRWLSLEPLLEDLGTLNLDGIHWVVVGGESGPGARLMHPDWARSIRDQCVAARVPFFFKQWGEFGWQQRYLDGTPGLGPVFAPIRVGKKDAGRLLDGQQWSQMP